MYLLRQRQSLKLQRTRYSQLPIPRPLKCSPAKDRMKNKEIKSICGCHWKQSLHIHVEDWFRRKHASTEHKIFHLPVIQADVFCALWERNTIILQYHRLNWIPMDVKSEFLIVSYSAFAVQGYLLKGHLLFPEFQRYFPFKRRGFL